MKQAIADIKAVKRILTNKGFEHILTTTNNGQDFNYGLCMFRHGDGQKIWVNIETVAMLKKIHC